MLSPMTVVSITNHGSILPDDGKMIIHLSPKYITIYVECERAWVSKSKCNSFLNQSGRAKGKGKSKGSFPKAMDNTTMQFNATSHAKTGQVVNDSTNHWEVWRELWHSVDAHAQARYKCKKIERKR